MLCILYVHTGIPKTAIPKTVILKDRRVTGKPVDGFVYAEAQRQGGTERRQSES